ncbi:coiled-coil domain-containing protein 166-like [Liolophura sinensis]|uniref:coiled-coil domain-containing protein 166-like n=1 Tax=Liolophura sinensis TaxID=3198878 RepID=UPI0031597EEA
MSYMEKKTSKRQTTIITLSDHNKQQIKNLEYQKQAMEEEFAERKEELKRLMLEKQHLLEKTQQEINNLQEYKNLQTEQQNKIKELEKEVKHVRAEHSNTIQHLKTKFITEKKSYQLDSDSKIQTLEKAANKEATKCLTDHSERIKAENRELRRELMNLIRTTRALHSHRLELEEQKKQLLREQQYSQDLKMLRTARQHHVFKPDGELRDGEEEYGRLHAQNEECKAVAT